MIMVAIAALLVWGKDPKSVIRVARLVVWLFAFIFVLHLFSHPGQRLFSILFLTATLEGARTGLFYGAKLVAFAYAAYIILLTVDPFELTRPLERAARYLGPAGRLISSFALSFSLALRFLPDLSREGRMTLLAFRARGIGFEGGLAKRARMAVQLVGTVFVNAFKKAESTSMALSVKGYATRYAKAVFPPVRFSISSMLVFSISVMVLGLGWRY
jgi:energy-coupling factor transporter transmembrane protein EcfT